MAHVKFTRHLKRYFPDIGPIDVDATTALEVVNAVDSAHPGFAAYVIDDQKSLRKHVNIFIGGTVISDRKNLSDVVSDDDEVYIMQALSGG